MYTCCQNGRYYKSGPEILPYLKDVIEKSSKKSQINVISFDINTVSQFKKLAPNIPAYWIHGTAREKVTKKFIPHDESLITLVNDRNLDGLDVDYHGVTKEFAEAVKATGMDFYVWTVNDHVEAQRLIDFGVDGITTDRPKWLNEELAKMMK